MLNIERALKQDRLLRAMTGLNRKAFDALVPTFSATYEQKVLQQPRQRALGGGLLPVYERLKTNCFTFFSTSKFTPPLI